MAVYRGSLPQDRFVSIANDWARDPRMKLSQRGLLVYIASHKSGYKLTVAQMVNECADGRDAVYSALKGLRELGYLRMVKHRAGGKGRISEVDYELVDPADEADDAPGVVGEPTTSGNSGSGATSGFSRSGQAGSGLSGSGESASKKNNSSKKTNAQNTTPQPPGSQLAVVAGSAGTDGKPSARTGRKPRTFMNEQWLPPVEAADKLAAELGVTRDQLGAWLPEFRDYWIGEGKSKADWVATWRNRMRERVNRGEHPGRPLVLSTTGRLVASASPGLDVLRQERERRHGAQPGAGDVVRGEVVSS